MHTWPQRVLLATSFFLLLLKKTICSIQGGCPGWPALFPSLSRMTLSFFCVNVYLPLTLHAAWHWDITGQQKGLNNFLFLSFKDIFINIFVTYFNYHLYLEWLMPFTVFLRIVVKLFKMCPQDKMHLFILDLQLFFLCLSYEEQSLHNRDCELKI